MDFILWVEIGVVFVFTTLFSMMGLGAAFLFVPLFYYLGVDLKTAIPTALFLNAVSMPFAVVTYARAGLIDYRTALPMLLLAAALAPLGARTSQYAPRQLLLWLFTLFLVHAGYSMLHKRQDGAAMPASSRASPALGAGVGGVAGFLGGLLGVGGGNFILPALNWQGYAPKIAVGTTSLVVLAASWAGFLGHATLAALSPRILALLGFMAVLGTVVGSRLTAAHLSGPQVKRLVGLGLWLVAAKILWDLL